MKKKFLALVLTLAMVLSLVPVTALAADTPAGGASRENTSDNLTMKKTVTPVQNQDGTYQDGTYTVHLESYATGSVTTTQAPVPMDFVLVLDVSGSMDGENGQIASYGYQQTKKKSWSAKDFYFTGTTYYAKIGDGDKYYPVSCQSKWVPGKYFGHDEYWLEANGQPLGNTGKWGEQLYSESLYTYGEVSGSRMSKLAAMKTAVNHFIDSVAAQKNGNTPVAHRISIVKFAGDPSDKVSNDTYTEGWNTYNYTQKVKELTDVTVEGNVDSLKTAVNALNAGGATRADLGMEKADGVLNGRQDAEKDRPSVVIMFTDGEPTTSDKFEWKVAGATVDTAKTLKDNGTKVYTIGMFNGANPEDTDGAFNKYMNGVSSKYPNAVGTKKNNNKDYNDIKLGTPAEGNYYFKADNAGDLDQVFQTISQSTTVTSPLDDKAVVVDNVPSNFALTKGSVKVYTENCTAKNDDTFEWSQKTESTSIKPEIENQSISVTGFNFSENWCGLDKNNQARGKKLIIEFTISRTNYGGTQPTNDGAYIKAGKVENEKPIISLENPKVPVTIELNETLGVNDEKPYDGEGFAILTKIAAQADTLANGTNNAYVDMALTVTVGNDIYTYKIPAKATTGSWYQGDSTSPMSDGAIGDVKTSKDVNRSTSNEVDVYTYNFDLTLSDADTTSNGAKSKEYKDNNASFKITPKDVTVKAKDKSVVAGQLAPTYEADVTGTINSDPVNYTIFCDYAPGATGTEFDIKPSGEAVQGNYNVTYRPGKLTVTEAPVTTGTLKVTKNVEGCTLDQLDQDKFKITVKGPSDYSKDLSLTDTGVTKDESKLTATWTISGLPAGEYTVSESDADVKGYDCTATYSATNGAIVIVNRDASAVQNQPATDAQTVTVAADSTSTMTVTNKYKKQEVEPTPDTSKPDVNKTATALVNDKTDVTLSVGGKSAKENVAVMFLLDKSTSMGTRTEAAKMLQHLKSLTNTNIIYDVVIFSGTASSTGWQDISNDAEYTDTQENFTNKEPSSGTNMPVGIDKAIQDMETLNSQYSSYAENAYLITISDGITYLWDEDGTTKTVPVAEKQAGVGPKVSKTVDTWDIMYGPGVSFENVYTDFASFLTSIPQKMEQTKESGYVCDYTTSNPKSYITVENTDKFSETNKPNQYACAPEFSVYYSATKYQELVKPFTKSFALPMPELKEDGTEKTTNWEYYPWGRELMLYLQSKSSNSGQGVVHDADAATIFAGIRNEILYEIKSGSITDVIGADFSLTDQTLTKDTFTLKVKGEKVAANEPSGNEITFGERDESTGKYPYVLTYYKGTATKNADNTYTITSGEKIYKYTPCDKTGEVNGSVSDEFFVLEMNVPVVSLDLTYNLSLTSKRTAAGTYEVPTNESATLAYKSANQNSGTVDFNEPTVSYTVKGSSGGHGGNGGGTVTIPDDVPTGLNGKDHYAYVVGYPDGMVYPQKNITRAEVATIFFRLLTDETREANMTKSNSYNDMKDGAWYTCAVSTLSKMGIIKGYEDGSFKPDASISRAEFAAIAARFDPDGDKTPATFSDVSSHWAKDEISIAANHGWIKGYEDGSFKPDQKITRAETMTLVNRVLKRLPETKDDLHKDMKTWPDNQKESAWFYLAVQEATNSHYQKLKKDGTHETWESMRETRDWAALEK